MSREIKRVPSNFGWPLGKVWEGYLIPDYLHLEGCNHCDRNGYSPEGRVLYAEWYGKSGSNFRPETPLTAYTPAVREFAQRNVSRSPQFYGEGNLAVFREGQRLVSMWNQQWSHHLSQDDVDALISAGRLMDFTHHFVPGTGWVLKDPAPVVTAEEVNTWNILSLGHDSSNAWICVKARAEREGIELYCPHCKGEGEVETWKGQKKAARKWKAQEPPKGKAYQLWETVSEGSPVSPAFDDPENLARWIVDKNGGSFESALKFVVGEGWVPSGIISASGVKTSEELISEY